MHNTIPKFLLSNGTQSPENPFPEKQQPLDHLGRLNYQVPKTDGEQLQAKILVSLDEQVGSYFGWSLSIIKREQIFFPGDFRVS